MKRWMVTLFAILLFITACGNSGKEANRTEKNANATVQGSTDGEKAEKEAPDANTESAEDTIKIASIMTTTGDYQQYGLPMRNAIKLSFDELNAKGGVNGKKIEMLDFDDKGDGVEAINAYNLALEKGATGVIGSVMTASTVSLADSTFEDNMPQITPTASALGVTVIDPEAEEPEVRTNVFRSCYTDPFQGSKMASYAKEKVGAKTAAVFYETGSDYSEGIANAFIKTAEKEGVTIVGKEAFGAGDKDFRAQMTKIVAKRPDVIFLPIYYSEAGLAVTAARTAGFEGVFLGSDGLGSVNDYASAEDLEGTFYCSSYASGTDAVRPFEQAYEKAFGEKVPNVFAALAYDAAMLMTEGIKSAEEQGLTAGTEAYREAMVEAIHNVQGVKGVTGSYSFDDQNNPIKDAAIIEIKAGEEVFKELY